MLRQDIADETCCLIQSDVLTSDQPAFSTVTHDFPLALSPLEQLAVSPGHI